jgi:membrane protein YqaA with SNARE-associated domain
LSPERRLTLLRIVALAAVVAISIYIFSIRERAEEIAVYGYPGIFILAFLAYATVLLPAPGVAVIFTMGAVFNPLAVALVAGAGAALGEGVGYIAGFSSRAIAERAGFYGQLTKWMRRNGPLTIFLLAAIPNPFFDLAGAAAGTLRMPVGHFFLWCWLGETVKMIFFAYGAQRC